MYHFIYPTKDTYIYELNDNSDKNFGGDNTLVLKKDFDGLTGLNAVSRVLLEFDFSELSQSLVTNEITNPKYYLRLYEKKTSELSPTYSLTAFPLSQSWEEGTGYNNQNPNSRDGVSWEKRNENFQHLSWSFTGSFDFNQESGSRDISGGGVWMTGSGYQASQSFSHNLTDVNMDVTDIVNNWLGGDSKIPNYGFILKWSGSQENSINHSGDINFFSSEANSIYSPKIEVRWDSHTVIGDTGLSQLVIDGTKDNYLYMMNLKDIYKETETPKFRVGGRERYKTKSQTTTHPVDVKPRFVPEGSGSYSIIDVATGETIVPFGEYSLFSSDSGSNYFKQDLKSLITNKNYRILLRLKTNDKKQLIFDDNFDFKVVS